MNDREAFALLWRLSPSWAGPRATRLVQSVARFETVYGRGWRNCAGMEASHNWGAIQGPGFPCRDVHADGTPYVTNYRVYPSDEAGAADLWRELVRRPLVRRVLMDDALDTAGLARAMRASGYFEATEKLYAAALLRNLKEILAS